MNFRWMETNDAIRCKGNFSMTVISSVSFLFTFLSQKYKSKKNNYKRRFLRRCALSFCSLLMFVRRSIVLTRSFYVACCFCCFFFSIQFMLDSKRSHAHDHLLQLLKYRRLSWQQPTGIEIEEEQTSQKYRRFSLLSFR